jgi:hypothetical protein
MRNNSHARQRPGTFVALHLWKAAAKRSLLASTCDPVPGRRHVAPTGALLLLLGASVSRVESQTTAMDDRI